MSAVHKLIEELSEKTTRVEKIEFWDNLSLMLKVRVLRENPGLSPILSNFHDVESFIYTCVLYTTHPIIKDYCKNLYGYTMDFRRFIILC